MKNFPSRSIVLVSRSEPAATFGPSLPGPTPFPLPLGDTLARALGNRKSFFIVIGGGPSEAARLVDESLDGLPGGVHVARAAARREAPLTPAMVIERILDSEPGSLRSSNLESAFATVIRGASEATVRRVLVIDEADYASRDLLGCLALLSTLLGSYDLSLKIILLGAPDFLDRCAPAIIRAVDGDDVVDLDTFADLSLKLPKRALAAASSPFNFGTANDVSTDPPAPGHRLPVALGVTLLLAGGVWTAAHLAGWDTALSVPARSATATLGRNAATLLSSLSSPTETLETPTTQAPRQAERLGNQNAPAPPPVFLQAPSSSEAMLPPAPPLDNTPQAGPALTPAAARSEPAFSPAVLATLMRRGDALLTDGNVAEARLLFERGASNSAAAALAEGKTYDPNFLAQIRATGVQPDRAAAASWYERARAMGDPQAADLLQRLHSRPSG